jgi:hypothetical protein
MSKQVGALAQQLGWFRNEGKNIGQGALDEQSMFEKAKTLAQWWNHAGKPMD